MTERIFRYLREQQPETPCLVIDLDVVSEAYKLLRHYLPLARVFYAVKANPAEEIVVKLRDLGSDFDVASRGEIDLCLAKAIAPDRISFGNTIKKERDIAYAYEKGVRLFAFDSAAELGKLARQAIDTSDELRDKDTADLFTGISRGVDKWLWFVESHLQADR